MVLSIDQLMSWFSGVFWLFLRVGGFFMVVPVIGSQLIPARIRIVLAFMVAVSIAPLLPPMPMITQLDVGLFLNVFVQLLSGIGLGFATVIFFQVFIITGQFIAMQMGLGFASMVDPTNGISVTILSQFFLLLVSLSFLANSGHLLMLEVLVQGFQLSAFGVTGGIEEMTWQLVLLGQWMFSGALMIAFPAVVSLLIVNLSFGVMTRAAPQLNIFSLGFPFSLVFGLLVIWFLIQGWSAQFQLVFSDFLLWAQHWSGL